VEIDGETSAVTQRFSLEVEKGEKKNRYAGEEVLFLKKEGGQWKIIKGL
jgi:ketosteroid isomerase-like protein